MEEENNGDVVFKYRGKKLPMRGKGKGGTHEGNIEEENNSYVVFKYGGKTPHEREGKGGYEENIKEENNGYVVFEYRWKNSP
jgi:hypothetical protein